MAAPSLSLPVFSILVSFSLLLTPTLAAKKSYVVYLGGHAHSSEVSSADYERVTDWHHEFLGSFLGSKDKAKEAIFYSYQKHINGFAANIEEEEAAEISKHPSVVSVFLNKGRKLHTTRSWQFLGLEREGTVPQKSIWRQARFGEDIIIANLDNGVWPESESFSDEGMGPIPSKWKGICEFESNNSCLCNKKLIGARYFNKGYEAHAGPLNATFFSARDNEGHGTHTLSTAGGGFVKGANAFGYANGTAKGGAPAARVAAYKVCWAPINGSECFDADILAAFDATIHDGVDVLSISLGGTPAHYFEDGIAIGSFHAVKNGITVVCSAGNSGPKLGSVSNVAPWIFTVGASTIDREFPSYAQLGNGRKYKGQSLSTDYLANTMYSLISSVDAGAANATTKEAQLCMVDKLDPKKVKGKIVVCLRGENARVTKGEAVRRAGGAAMILANDEASGNEIIADAHVLPATHVNTVDGLAILFYINSTKLPTAYISPPVTKLDTKPAPFMAAFSSQGPNTVTPQILKPDITAPGVSILAAYSEAASPTGLVSDRRRSKFYMDSGTSMSCPHIAGIVGLLKVIHPEWSPAAVRSATMTTARTRDNMKQPISNASFVEATPFSYGAGHVRPNRAMDPGLVYDLNIDDYLNFLCHIGYNSSQFANLNDQPYSCPPASTSAKSSILDLNYPSITVTNLTDSATVTRRVKNVGPPGSTYMARVHGLKGVSVRVEPSRLEFERMGQELSFQVTFTLKRRKSTGLGGGYVFGRLIWSDGVHYVRSPIVVN